MRPLTCLAVALLVASSLHGVAGDSDTQEPVTIDDIPARFRDAPAVMLRSSWDWDVVPWRRSSLTVRHRLLILDRRGYRHADQSVTYEDYGGKLAAFYAQTVLPSGEIVPVPEDLKNELASYVDQNQEWRTLHFTFPRVEPGVVLEWGYTVIEKEASLSRAWPVQRDIPVLESRFEAQVKTANYYEFVFRDYKRVDADDNCEVVRNKSGGRKVTFEAVCRDVPALSDEALAPPEADRRLEFLIRWASAEFDLASWSGKADFYRRLIRMFSSERDAVSAKAKQLVTDDMTDEQKLDAVYGFIRAEIQIRDSLDLDGNELPSVDDTLANGGGVPMLITALTMAMLEEAGVQVAPVLVQDRTRGRFVYSYPDTSQAGHLMLRVNVDGNQVLLDPSCRFCEPGTPDWRYCDKQANGLRIGGVPALFSAGVRPAEYNAEIRKQQIAVTPDGAAHVEGEVTWTGHTEVALRRWQDGLSETVRDDAFRSMLAGETTDFEFEVHHTDELFENLSASYSFSAHDLPPLADGRLLVRPIDTFTADLPVPLQEERVEPVWIPYAYAVQSDVTFHLPEGYWVREIPAAQGVLNGPGMTFRHEWRRGDVPNEIYWKGVLTVSETEVLPDDYAEARSFALMLRHVLQGGIVAIAPVDEP